MSGWPWPLDAVQSWFDGLWDWVATAAIDAVDVVSGWITDSASWLWNQVQSVGVWIVDSATSIVGTLGKGIVDLKIWLGGAFTGAVDTIVGAVSGAETWLNENIGPTLEGFGVAVSDAAGGIASFIESSLGTVGQALGDAGNFIVGTLTGWIDGALRWASDSFTWLAEQVEEVGDNIINSVSSSLSGIGEAISGGLSATFGPIIKGAEGVFEALSNLAVGFDPSQLISDAMVATQTIFDTFTTALSSKSIRSPEEAYTIAWDTITQVSAAFMTQTISLITAEAASLGQVDETLSALQHMPHLESSYATVQSLFSTMADISLIRPLSYFYNRAFTPELPPTPDLIQFVVREAILPERFFEMMTWKGFSMEWASAYWEAHWKLPDPTKIIDAFHRGKLSEANLNGFLVLHDFRPTPRPGMEKSDVQIYRDTLKTLIPRVDLRYAWEMGQLSREDIVERYKWIGYEDDAELMADIQINRAMVEEINKVRNEDLGAFVSGFSGEDIVRANLSALGISELRVDYYVEYAKKRRERNQTKELLDIYQDGYVNDLIDDQELEVYSESLIVDEDARELFLQRAYVRKYKKPAPPKAEKVKVASLAMLASLYRQDALTVEDFKNELINRNYPSDQVSIIIEVEDLKIAAAAKAANKAVASPKAEKVKVASLATLASLYRQYVLTVGEFQNELMNRNYSSDQIGFIVLAEDLKIAAAEEGAA